MEAALGSDMAHEPMTVAMLQELLKKLNLDDLSNWTPRNAAATRELILAFHDIFVLEGNKLGCMSAIQHEICINNSKPFRSSSDVFLCHFLMRYMLHSETCWTPGQYVPASPCGAMQWY